MIFLSKYKRAGNGYAAKACDIAIWTVITCVQQCLQIVVFWANVLYALNEWMNE